jgi:hypothetical protein
MQNKKDEWFEEGQIINEMNNILENHWENLRDVDQVDADNFRKKLDKIKIIIHRGE